jgi:hypothetical protein
MASGAALASPQPVIGCRYLHLSHSEHKGTRVSMLWWGRWCDSWLMQSWKDVSTLTDTLQCLAVDVAPGIQMEPGRNELVEQGL